MGNIFSTNKNGRGNRVSNTGGVPMDNPESETENVKVDDYTRRAKGKSKSMMNFSRRNKPNRLHSQLSSPNIYIEDEKSKLKLNYERQIQQLTKDMERIKEENTTLRNEVKMLNATLPKLRADKDKAIQDEKVAMARAAALESEKDKLQRQFKMYRESKEEEIRSILKQKQALSALLDCTDSRDQCQPISEWRLDNQPVTDIYSLDRYNEMLLGVHNFINLKTHREICCDLQALSSSLHSIKYGIPKTNVYSIYIMFTEDMVECMQLFSRYCNTLMYQYETFDRLISFTHIPYNFQSNGQEYVKACKDLLGDCDIFIAFIGLDNDKKIFHDTLRKVNSLHKQSIFGCQTEPSAGDDIFINKDMHHIISGYNSIESFVNACVSTLTKICRTFFEQQQLEGELVKEYLIDRSYNEIQFDDWNVFEMLEQKYLQENIFNCLQKNMVNTDTDYNSLKSHVLQDGFVQPLLVTGKPGSGKSFLLARLINDLKNTLPNVCILYHVTSTGLPCSRNTSCILRRFVFYMVDVIPSTYNVQQLEIDFPHYLERACRKYSNGIIIVIDGADLLDNIDHLKWLLDPLQVPVRVVISVTSENYPKKWKSWIQIPLTNQYKDPLHLFTLQCRLLSCSDHHVEAVNDVLGDELDQVINEDNLYNHLFRNISAILFCESKSFEDAKECLEDCLSQKNVTDLYMYVISYLSTSYNNKLIYQVLSFLLICHHGIHLMEFKDLLASYELLDVYVLLSVLIKYRIVVKICGLYHLTQIQVHDAIRKYFSQYAAVSEEENFRKIYTQLFWLRFKRNFVSYRIADELLWQLKKNDQKDDLYMCLTSDTIILCLFKKGRLNTLIDCWNYIDRDINAICDVYLNVFSKLDEDDSSKERLFLLYDVLGELLLDCDQYQLAHSSFEKSLELKEAELESDDPKIGYSIICLGRLFTKWKKFQTAEDYYKQALQAKDLNGQTNTIPYAKCLEWLGILYQLQDKSNVEQSCYKQALQIRKFCYNEYTYVRIMEMIGELYAICRLVVNDNNKGFDLKLFNHIKEIAALCFNMHEIKDAIDIFNYALQLLSSKFKKDHLYADVLCQLSCAYIVEMENGAARKCLEEAVLIYLNKKPPKRDCLNQAWENLIDMLYNEELFAEIENWFRKIGMLEIKLCEEAGISVAEACEVLDNYLSKKEKFDQIEDWLKKILLIQKEISGDNSLAVASSTELLALHLTKKKNIVGAIHFFHETVMIYGRHIDFQDRSVSKILYNMALILKEHGRKEIADQLHNLIYVNEERSLQDYISLIGHVIDL